MLGNMAPNERIAIALDSKTVIGVGALVDQDIAQIPQTPFISTIYVTKKYRKNQLGTAIVSKLEHTAQQLGYKDVFIISSLDNFYEKMHFSKIDDIIDFMNRPMKLYQKSLR
ncbi:GNAT family N-acetyltransferase [Weissella coleopterorum]|uniref:GNAT family N-acetyltransferase n=1 Tax=Weissella coleopterorum TaxID=2714949 RepID=UPI001FE636C5|nr:GNAT family N-acetyltransferase [Weissella coleopterorum]